MGLAKRVGAFSVVFLIAGCGGGVSGTASILNGPTPAARAKAPYDPRIVPGDGQWNLSPDKMRLTLVEIGLHTEGASGPGSTAEVNCVVEYDRSKPGLTKLADCPFEIDPGTYKGLSVSFSNRYEVLVDDTNHGIFSDPASSSSFSSTQPSGGGQWISVTTTSSGDKFSNSSVLATPFTVQEGQPIPLSIVVNGLQFLKVNVTGGNISVGWPSGYPTDPFRPDMTGSLTSIAQLGHYVHSSIGDALSYNFTTVGAGVGGILSASVFYSDATTPTALFLGLNGNPSCGSLGVAGAINSPPNGFGLGGYLGLSGGTLGWALPTDNSWATYAARFTLEQKTSLGDAAAFKCKSTSTDPNPSGGTFTSAPPDTTGAETSLTLKLVAK